MNSEIPMPKHKKSKENSELHLHCTLCQEPTGTKMTLGELTEKIPDFDQKQTHYRHGLCKECAEHLAQGGVFFTDSKERVVKVSVEASLDKIQEGFRGKIIKVPCSAMAELLKVWAQSIHLSPQPPPESGDSESSRADDGNG